MAGNPDVQLTSVARGLMSEMQNKGASFAPYQFVTTMKQVFPQFDERDERGHPKQQDADECFNLFLQSFKNAFMYAKKKDEKDEMVDEGDDQNPIDKLFGIEMENTTKN